MLSRLIPLSAVTAAAFLLVSCASVPRMELDAARQSIMTSEKVNAAKYAPDELASAKRLYLSATNQVAQKKNKDAKLSALQSKSTADKAYFKALDEFVKDQAETTAKSRDEALESHADASAPDEFSQAQALHDEAQKEMNELKVVSEQLRQLILLREQAAGVKP